MAILVQLPLFKQHKFQVLYQLGCQTKQILLVLPKREQLSWIQQSQNVFAAFCLKVGLFGASKL